MNGPQDTPITQQAILKRFAAQICQSAQILPFERLPCYTRIAMLGRTRNDLGMGATLGVLRDFQLPWFQILQEGHDLP